MEPGVRTCIMILEMYLKFQKNTCIIYREMEDNKLYWYNINLIYVLIINVDKNNSLS